MKYRCLLLVFGCNTALPFGKLKAICNLQGLITIQPRYLLLIAYCPLPIAHCLLILLFLSPLTQDNAAPAGPTDGVCKTKPQIQQYIL